MYSGTNTLKQDILKAINGEYSAIACYARLAEVAPTKEERDQILEIRKDEINHYQVFTQIFISITGTQPNPYITESCPQSYVEGLHFAFRDEQETVDFYLEIADKSQDPCIKERFKRAAADEQNHAVWFLYFSTKYR